jgi:type I restriction enzyme, S subunit
MSTMDEQIGEVIDSDIDVMKLKEEMVYEKNSCAWFFTKKDNNWLLSNMAGQMPTFFPKGVKWNSSEQLYQASKYFPGTICLPELTKGKKDVEPDVRKRIATMTNARGAKMTQKCAVKAGLVRDDWEDQDFEVRIHSMMWVLELKLRDNPLTFGRELSFTGTKAIVEVSRKDDFWGCKEVDGKLVGKNVLGKLLMLLRERAEKVRKGEFSYPSGFLLD